MYKKGITTADGTRTRASGLLPVLLLVSMTAVACKPPEPTITDVAVFVDWTEVEEHNGICLLDRTGDLDRILAEVVTPDMTDARLNGGSIVFYPINSHGLLRAGRRVALAAGDPNGNKMVRLKAIRQFYDDVNATYLEFLKQEQDTAENPDTPYSASYIVQPVCQYLATITGQANARHRRYLLLYSDLLEHSSVFSFYLHRNTPEYFDTHAEDVADTLLTACAVVQAPLSVAYRLLPQPLSKEDPGRLQYHANRVWRLVFEKLGLREDPVFAS